EELAKGRRMSAKEFAEWLSQLLDESHPSRSHGAGPYAEEGALRIVVLDGAGGAAEVTFEGQWVWETIDHIKDRRGPDFNEEA
ncbi:MAG: hypothetical protein KAI25_09725, partial [Hyphomicrobiaceae bacterium]|nr:hypothetical protein [Hyphomicrobiaceae bacterium]